MTKTISHSETILNLNERLFINALEGVTEEQMKDRISDHNNPLNWIVQHTVWARFNTAALLGKPTQNPYDGMFEGFKPWDETMKFDSIETLKENWGKASKLIREGFDSVTDEHMAADAPMQNPTGDNSIAGTISFLAHHECYDIGQMGFLKKYLTKEAMSYS